LKPAATSNAGSRTPPRPLAWLAAAALWCVLPARPAASDSTRSVWDGVYSEEQARRGGLVYQQHCTPCHGPTLAGIDAAGPLTGPVFTSNWNGVTLGDMLDRVRMSMPQDRTGTLSRQQIADVLAFVLSANSFPPGESELTRRSEFLRLILFEATRPAAKPAAPAVAK